MKKSEKPAESCITVERIVDHKTNKFNRECVEIHTADEKQSDGANHRYSIEVSERAFTAHDSVEGVPIVEKLKLNFQNGNPFTNGGNGITDEALIAVVLHRQRDFQQGKFANRDTALAITHLEDALFRLENRSKQRASRGVEGGREV